MQLQDYLPDKAENQQLPLLCQPFFAFFGGAGIFFLVKNGKSFSILIALSTIAFTFTLLVGAYWGIKIRTDYEVYQNHQKLLYNSLEQRLKNVDENYQIERKKVWNEIQLQRDRKNFEQIHNQLESIESSGLWIFE